MRGFLYLCVIALAVIVFITVVSSCGDSTPDYSNCEGCYFDQVDRFGP